MSYLLDTDICIYILNAKDPNLQKRFREHAVEGLSVSALTEAELYFGALRSTSPAQNRERIQLLLDPITIIPFDSTAAHHFAEIKLALAQQGRPTGAMDLLIAATAKAYNFTLVTNNVRHFQNIPNLAVENWTP